MKGNQRLKRKLVFICLTPVLEKGTYKVRLKKENQSNYSFFKSKCLQTSSPTITKPSETVSFDEQNIFPLMVNAVCQPFDFFESRSEDLYDEFFFEVIKLNDESSVDSEVLFFNVPHGTKKIEFDKSKLKSNSRYNAYFYLPAGQVKLNLVQF